MTFPRIAFLCAVLTAVPHLVAQPTPTDLKVEVKLKNGSSIGGVVQSGRLVERLVRGGYAPAVDPTAPGSGIRIWYYRQQKGFVFLRYRNIDVVNRLGAVSQEEVARLRGQVKKAEEARRASPAKKAPPKSTGKAPSKAAVKATKVELTEAEKSLLEEFPTDEWDRDRYGKLQTARLLGGELRDREKRFVAVFDRWDIARRSRDANATKAPVSSPTDND